MDYEEKKRKQLIRVVIAEIGMVISVIAIVIVSVMLAMGYFIADTGQIEQTGLMQLHSSPTGASVELNGTTLFSRTNLSRTLAEGEHTLKLSRDGYDTWQKTITMQPGVLRRIYYPRLILMNRKTEEVKTLGKEKDRLAFYSPSKTHKYVLYMVTGAEEWRLIDLRSDNVRETKIEFQEKLKQLVTDKVAQIEWSADDTKVLVKLDGAEKTSWVLVDLNDPKKSLDITDTFGLAFEKMKIIDTGANRLYALENGALRVINATNSSMSKVLAGDVVDAVSYGSSVAYITRKKDMTEIRTYREGEEDSVKVVGIEGDQPVKIALSHYYDDDYLAYAVGKKVTIKYGVLPRYKTNSADDELKATLVEELALAEEPVTLEVSPDGGYLAAMNNRSVDMIDLETGEASNYGMESGKLNWLDASMLYEVRKGEITVWDFDGENMRNLASSGQILKEKKINALSFPVLLSENGRWIYYLTTGKNDTTLLVREKIKD